MSTKKIRLLTDFRIEEFFYRCNDLVEPDEKLAAQLVRDGIADDHPEAVAYLEGQGVKAKRHGETEQATPVRKK